MNKKNIGSKLLYSNTNEGITTHIQVRYNQKTNHIGIYTQFQKSHGWSGIINNKNCSNYLGVTIAEQVLFNVFNHVERMPIHNSGYDFKCTHGYMIDVKASTTMKNRNSWLFHIYQNPVADYFLCLAFDNRTDLNPMHIWLIPAKEINRLKTLTISESRLDKWSKYELSDKMDKVYFML